MYDSDVFSGQPLRKVRLGNVKVYRPVSFEHTKIEYVEGAHEAEEHEANLAIDALQDWINWYNLAQPFVKTEHTGDAPVGKTMAVLNGVEG